jgi:hypothetical protein
VNRVELAATLTDVEGYAEALRSFVGRPTPVVEGEFELGLRLRTADAGASAASSAADEAVLPSLRDFLGR